MINYPVQLIADSIEIIVLLASSLLFFIIISAGKKGDYTREMFVGVIGLVAVVFILYQEWRSAVYYFVLGNSVIAISDMLSLAFIISALYAMGRLRLFLDLNTKD